ncbi:MAG: HdeD family acid-resistance protein [Alphaproteobacteria bacterium]|jgi:uncharacterized membrane protein HdeD (DUF308 family)|nr:MAG: HdeD family acid-resistance protein [Alphaproteobacteria bacterium]
MAEVSNPLLQECRSSLALRSGAAVLFGIACLWPTIADAMLIKLFAVYAFVDGILTLSSGGRAFSRRSAWPLLLGGCVGVVIGATAYASPAMTLVGFTNLLTAWALALGMTFTVAAATLRGADRDYLFLLSGIASGLFARALLTYTAADIVVISTWTGLYGLTIGILFLKLTLQQYQLVALDLSVE